MPKFRKKPVVIEAIQATGTQQAERVEGEAFGDTYTVDLKEIK